MQLKIDPLAFKKIIIVLIAATCLIYGIFFAPAAPLIIDETIYSAAIQRFAEEGSLTIRNGYDLIEAPTLKVMSLLPSGNVLAPQYPSGYPIIAALFFLIAGVQGIIVLNTLAALGVLGIAYLIANELFNDEQLTLNAVLILSGATFLFDYAFAIWPHALSALLITLAAYCAVLSQKRETTYHAAGFAALAGLAVGLGLNIRIDTILAAPALAVWFLGSVHSPWARLSAFFVALAPGLMLSSSLNFLKFATFNPLSYGHQTAGLASVSYYTALMPLILVAAVLAICMTRPWMRAQMVGYRALLISTTIVALILSFPTTRDIFLQLLRGLYVLLIDIQSYDHIDRQPGVYKVVGERLLFWHQVKKSLFDSLPYAGFLAVPLAALIQKENRSAFGLCWIIPTAWFAFYGFNQWFGGSGINMRYFTPTLPFLSVLTAYAWREIGSCRKWGEIYLIAPGTLVLLSTTTLLSIFLLKFNSVIPLFFLLGGGKTIFYTSLFFALFWILVQSRRSELRRATQLVFSACLFVGFISTYFYDFQTSQAARLHVKKLVEEQMYEAIEPNALVISMDLRPLASHLAKPDGLVARGIDSETSIDFHLIDWALKQGRPVYLHTHLKHEFDRHPVSRHFRLRELKHTLEDTMLKVEYAPR